LSVNEFFRWSLSKSSSKYGSHTLEAAFERYDKDGTGELELHEFERACADMGFGAMAVDIFRSIDHDGSGSVTYRELVKTLNEETPVDPHTKQMLSALVWSHEAGSRAEAKRALDTTGWVVRGDDVASVRSELQELLAGSGAHVCDLIKLFDEDNDTELLVDEMEFHKAMVTKFGYAGNSIVLFDVFRSLDTDGSGSIGFDELYEFVRGKRHSLDNRSKRELARGLVPPPGSPRTLTLDTIAWDVETLRVLMQQMLDRCKVSPSELFRAWDRDGDKELTRTEWLQTMHSWFFQNEQPDLWDREVRSVADAAFTQVEKHGERDSRHRSSLTKRGVVDLHRLQRWLIAPGHTDMEVKRKSWDKIRRIMKFRLRLSKEHKAPRVSRAQIARAGIATAKERTAAREVAAKEAIEEHVRQWRASRETQVNGQRWELPPLQRWEPPRLGTPKAFEALSLRVAQESSLPAAPPARIRNIASRDSAACMPSMMETHADGAWPPLSPMSSPPAWREATPRVLSPPLSPRSSGAPHVKLSPISPATPVHTRSTSLPNSPRSALIHSPPLTRPSQLASSPVRSLHLSPARPARVRVMRYKAPSPWCSQNVGVCVEGSS